MEEEGRKMESSKKQSSVFKDAFVLFGITLIAALLLGFVNELTDPVIKQHEAEAKAAAYQAVYPDATMVDTEDATITAMVENAGEQLKAAGLEGIRIDEAGIAKDKDGTPIGYVMTITTANGYNGDITLTMGYTSGKMITGIEIIKIGETPNLGLRATEDAFKGQFAGKTAEWLTVTKTGASAESEIDAISSATITSNAVTGAVNAGITFALECLAGGIGGVAYE